MATFLLTTPCISPHDAVSNDVLAQAALLRSNGHSVHIYAEQPAEQLRHLLITNAKFKALARSPKTTWIYHHSVLWERGEEILRKSKARKIMRYHNITPTHFFETVEDHGAIHATKYGIDQTKRFVGERIFDLYMNASVFNSLDLISMGGDSGEMVEVAPFHKVEEFSSASLDDQLASKVRTNNRINVLFVGRFAPNKGHIHMFRVLERYASLFGENIQLHIAGNIHIASPKYRQLLQDEVASLAVGDMLTIWSNVSHDQLHTLYASCDAFLLMSEHEGFCVPIIEAQHHGLPVVSYATTAIPETLGDNQICYNDADYELFAAALNTVANDTEVKQCLAHAGRANVSRYSLPLLSTKFVSALNAYC